MKTKAARANLHLPMTNSSQPDNSIAARLEESGGQMTFFEHLSELRKRIINSLYAIGIGAFVGSLSFEYFIKWITDRLSRRLVMRSSTHHLIYTHPPIFEYLITLACIWGLCWPHP